MSLNLTKCKVSIKGEANKKNMAKPVFAEICLHKTKPVHEFELGQKCKANVKCEANKKNMAKLAHVEIALCEAKLIYEFELDQ